MEDKKYEVLNDDVINYVEYSKNKLWLETAEPIYLHRIRALKDFGNVKKGQLGGYIEDEENLSQKGNCWVDDKSYVLGHVFIKDNSLIINSEIEGVFNNTIDITGDSVVKECDIYTFIMYKKIDGKGVLPYLTKNIINNSNLYKIQIENERKGMFEIINSNVSNSLFYSEHIYISNSDVDYDIMKSESGNFNTLDCQIFIDNRNINDYDNFHNLISPHNRYTKYLVMSFFKPSDKKYRICYFTNYYRDEKNKIITHTPVKCMIYDDINDIESYVYRYILKKNNRLFNSAIKYFKKVEKWNKEESWCNYES